MARILPFYALSGFVSLAYQVAWFRIVTDWFGSTNYTFVLVVANFIGGLAVGSLLSRRVTAALVRGPWLRAGLRDYGLIELLVAVSIGLTLIAGALPQDLFGSFPYVERGGIWVHTLGYRLFQGTTATVAIFVPCFFMGVTFPLLCDRFRDEPGGDRFPAALYTANTLGACTGVLVCQFLFLPWLGHVSTLWTMAVSNALLGAWFLLGPAGSSRSAEPARAPVGASSAGPSLASAPASLLAWVTVGGFIAGAMEGDLFKRVTFAIELNPGATMTFISFWAVLAIFLASLTVHRFAGLSLTTARLGFAIAFGYCAAVWPFIDPIRDFVEATVLPAPVEVAPSLEGFRNLQFPTGLTQLLVFVGILVFPPYFLASLLLPRVCNELQRESRHLGLAYGLNTLAFCIGLVAFVWIAPRVNIFYSLKLFPVVLGVCSAWLFLVSGSQHLPAWKPVALLVGLVVVAAVVPADFDTRFFRPGTPPTRFPIRELRSNGAHTTFIVDGPGTPRLYFDRLQMSGTNLRAQTYMRLMAHFPLLLNPRPEKALLICLGVGNTGSAIARHESVSQIDIVDLNEKIFETAPGFADVNQSLHLDSRVRFIHDDGRNFLRLTDEKYDLVTSEPPPPLAAGVYRLYSREYYETVLAHLSPQGFMTQWLPLFLMTPEAVDMAVRTFVDVFPHAFLFAGFGTDFILAGSPTPIDLEAVRKRFRESSEVREELQRFHVRTTSSLLARIVQSDGRLRQTYGTADLIRDRHNDLERFFPDPGARAVVAYDPTDVAAYLRERAPASAPEVEPILMHLGRLRYHVQGYPFETLAGVDPVASRAALAGIDWLQLAELFAENVRATRAGDENRSIATLGSFLEISPEQPEVLIALAQIELGTGRYDDAIRHLRAFVGLEPDDYLGRLLLANAYHYSGRSREALVAYQEAARSHPAAPEPIERMARILATDPDPDIRDPARALELVERASALSGEELRVLAETQAAAEAAAGHSERAAATLQALIDRVPKDEPKHQLRRARQRDRYRDGETLIEDHGRRRGSSRREAAGAQLVVRRSR